MRQKYKSAEHAQQTRENRQSWEKLLAKYEIAKLKPQQKTLLQNHLDTPTDRSCRHIPSLNSRLGQPTVRKVVTYSGNEMIGIATLHKSNSVPVFNKQDAIDVAKMRRG